MQIESDLIFMVEERSIEVLTIHQYKNKCSNLRKYRDYCRLMDYWMEHQSIIRIVLHWCMRNDLDCNSHHSLDNKPNWHKHLGHNYSPIVHWHKHNWMDCSKSDHRIRSLLDIICFHCCIDRKMVNNMPFRRRDDSKDTIEYHYCTDE